jgi:hypothetical protein
MSKCTDWEWDEKPMREVEAGLEEYMDKLYSLLADGFEGSQETESTDFFCGCDTCHNREVMAYLMPRFIDLYIDGSIRRWEEGDNVVQLVPDGTSGDAA